ncbi:hypothetical protein CB1_001984019 [Camelus ferus]|nr:hypothetical protein CB1_001984019 [Camelus ferus]
MHENPQRHNMEEQAGLYVLVGAGALMMAVGFFGCCGAMRESQCVLGSFQCCGKESSEQVQLTCPKELLGHKNCIEEIETIISVKLQLIGIVGIGIAGLTVRKFQSVTSSPSKKA